MKNKPSVTTVSRRFLSFAKRGLAVLGGFGIDDLKPAPLKHWQRLGCPAAYCHLEGSQGFVGVFIAEIPPRKRLKPYRMPPVNR